jgi:hypothetical protein
MYHLRKMLRQAQHEDLSGLHPELIEGVEGLNTLKAILGKSSSIRSNLGFIRVQENPYDHI